jgi:hypothetical protein
VQSLSYWTIVGRIDQFTLGILAFHYRAHVQRRHLLAVLTFLAFTAYYHWFNLNGGWQDFLGYPSTAPVWVFQPSVEGLAAAILIAWYDTSFKFAGGRAIETDRQNWRVFVFNLSASCLCRIPRGRIHPSQYPGHILFHPGFTRFVAGLRRVAANLVSHHEIYRTTGAAISQELSSVKAHQHIRGYCDIRQQQTIGSYTTRHTRQRSELLLFPIPPSTAAPPGLQSTATEVD